tara:strand:+ start:742 stop:2346 length:1605 start_codon:yes stop_codon:yes gene_type:complete
MKKILLVTPIQPFRQKGSFWIGIYYIASYLRENNYNVSVFDFDNLRPDEAKLRKMISESDFDLVGITGMATSYNYVKWLSSLIKEYKPNIPIVLGGPLATTVTDILLNHTLADYLIIGEGERVMINLINSLKNNENLENVKGIAYKKNSKIIKTEGEKLINKLDSLPFPAWDLSPIREILDCSNGAFVMIASRSCPYRCSFCHLQLGRGHRRRSPENVIGEMEILVEKYGASVIAFQDQVFGVDKKWTYDFCTKLLSKKLNVKWKINSAANVADYDLYVAMKKAGCCRITIGFESGSDTILKEFKKANTRAKADKVIKICRKAGFEPSGGIVIGSFGENAKTINETVNFMKENNLYSDLFFFLTLFPGTEMYQRAIDQNLIKENEDLIIDLANSHSFTRNITKMSAFKLIYLKAKAERDVYKHYAKNNQAEILSTNGSDNGMLISVRCKQNGCTEIFRCVLNKGANYIKCPDCSKQYFINGNSKLKNFGLFWYLKDLAMRIKGNFFFAAEQNILLKIFSQKFPQKNKRHTERYW